MLRNVKVKEFLQDLKPRGSRFLHHEITTKCYGQIQLLSLYSGASIGAGAVGAVSDASVLAATASSLAAHLPALAFFFAEAIAPRLLNGGFRNVTGECHHGGQIGTKNGTTGYIGTGTVGTGGTGTDGA